MNLNEAFRYQNFLEATMNTLKYFFSDDRNVMRITQTHKRKEALNIAEDTVEDASAKPVYAYTPDVIIAFYKNLLEEKIRLTQAIHEAKRATDFDVDAEIAINNSVRTYIASLKSLAGLKENERTYRGTGYVFNAEGNQVQYYYNIEEKSEPNYDRNDVKKLLRKASEKADEVSAEIARYMLDADVNYTPYYPITDSVDDMLEKFTTDPDTHMEIGTL